MLSEQEIFNQLTILCGQKGFIHALVQLNFDNNYCKPNKNGSFTEYQLIRSYVSEDKIIRNELMTLLILVIKYNPNFFYDEIPTFNVLEKYIQKTKKLLESLHDSFKHSLFNNVLKRLDIVDNFKNIERQSQIEKNFFLTKGAIREAIFYGGDGVYSFQYQDLACLKYIEDNQWIIREKGFSIETAFFVIEVIFSFHHYKIFSTLEKGDSISLKDFVFSKTELIDYINEYKKDNITFSISELSSFIDAFSFDINTNLSYFKHIDDFNPLIAYPFIKFNDKFLLFDLFNISQAFYETSFFWMLNDPKYKNIALKNRGVFTERFTYEILCKVFGKENVWRNIELYSKNDGIKSKNKLGEIDILVFISGHALVFQAKSKKLTLESRKGNIGQLSSDFSKAIQDAYNQSFDCSEILLTNKYVAKIGSQIIHLPRVEFCYPICILSEYFPALIIQIRCLLEEKQNKKIANALIFDIFLLDLMSKTLLTPLDFLHFISSFSKSRTIFLANTQIEILSAHLQGNWLCSKEADMFNIGSDFSAKLDIYISKLRRRLLDKQVLNIPSGWMKFKNTYWGKLFDFLACLDSRNKLKFGLELMQFSGELIENYNLIVDQRIHSLCSQKKVVSDFSLYVGDHSGLTVYVVDNPLEENVINDITVHSKLRKYNAKVDLWFALILSKQGDVKYFDVLDFKWEYNQSIQNEFQNTLGKKKILKTLVNGKIIKKKIGRNDLCPCNSGKKYKRCCLKN